MRASWKWSNLYLLKDKFVDGLPWQVGDGNDINFWDDIWFSNNKLVEKAINPQAIDKTLRVADFIQNSNQWDIDKLNLVLDPQSVQEISRVHIPTNKIQDRLYWGPSKNGWFSTNSAFTYITKNKSKQNTDIEWIWKLDTFPKVKNFIWKMALDGIPTKATLRKRIFTYK